MSESISGFPPYLLTHSTLLSAMSDMTGFCYQIIWKLGEPCKAVEKEFFQGLISK